MRHSLRRLFPPERAAILTDSGYLPLITMECNSYAFFLLIHGTNTPLMTDFNHCNLYERWPFRIPYAV